MDNDLIKQAAHPLYAAKGWMKFLGILSIIYGALMVLSLWGIILCWLPIWMGILLLQAAGQIEPAYLNSEETALTDANNKLKTFFTVYGVLALIGIVVTVIGFIVFLSVGMSALSNM